MTNADRIRIGENMEDRYLFRAKRVDDGKWVVWNIFSGLYGADIDKSTICQCTGLKDKNNNLIWENDILIGYLDDNYPQNATYEMVIWNKSGFCTKEQGSNDISEFCEFDQKNFEVCGNIFDNPELIESEE